MGKQFTQKQIEKAIQRNHKKTEKKIDQICSATFTRHANLTEDEFLKEIGKTGNEKQAVREAKMALLVGCMKELLQANTTLALLNAKMEYLKENK